MKRIDCTHSRYARNNCCWVKLVESHNLGSGINRIRTKLGKVAKTCQ